MNTFSELSSDIKTSEWWLSQEQLTDLNDGVIETLFSIGNGTIGSRGTSSYKAQSTEPVIEGTYINGAYIREAIEYDESAYGFAQFNNKMLQVNNSKQIQISIGDEIFEPVGISKKYLDMQSASFYEVLELTTPSGKTINLTVHRIICQHDQYLMINNFDITAVNFSGQLTISSFIAGFESSEKDVDDPRAGNLVQDDSQIVMLGSGHKGALSYVAQEVTSSNNILITASSHTFNCDYELLDQSSTFDAENNYLSTKFNVEIKEKQCVLLTKYSLYLHEELSVNKALADISDELNNIKNIGFDAHFIEHQSVLNDFWEHSDITIGGHEQHQRAIRLNMLHLFMSSGRDGLRNIAAKGLSGPGYDGHYFWDSEIYISPYFSYTQPEIAKNLLVYRHKGLAKAKSRAQEMGHEQGVLFPWRTISGEECSSYFPAGTAQYHINTAIAYAVKSYFSITQDWQFIWNFGAELVVETARLWPSLGHFNSSKGGLFCIDGVTGPDEYTAIVNNNYYTNSMVQIHLNFAVKLFESLEEKDSHQYYHLLDSLNLSAAEIKQWAHIAENIYLPHDQEKGITPQDDSFLNKKPWDFAGVDKSKYPLLLHFHPLVIYRHQVLKQSDVILANFLQDEAVSVELKRKNLDFYEPITTHDSTLSACSHSIAYCEVGNHKAAFDYFDETILTDLHNLHHNTHYGIHTAAMAGSWMCVTQGFAGLRIRDNYLYFNPSLPTQWTDVSFKVKAFNCKVLVMITQSKVAYQLLNGEQINIKHQTDVFTLNDTCSSKIFSFDNT